MKRILPLLAILLLATAPLSGAAELSDADRIAELESVVVSLQEQIDALRQQLGGEQTETPAIAIAQGDKIVLGEMLVAKSYEMTFNTIEFSYKVLPDDTSGLYTTYSAESGKVYVHLDVDVKNTQKQQLRCDKIATVSVDYDNGYTYTGFATVEDRMTGFTYANISSIDPLETKGMRYLISCPEEVETSVNPVRVIVTIDDHDYSFQLK